MSLPLAEKETAHRLSYHFNQLYDQAKNQRWKQSGLNLGIGALTGAGAVATYYSGNEKTKQVGVPALGILSGIFTFYGGYLFFSPSPYESWLSNYRNLSEIRDPTQRKVKVHLAEQELKSLALRKRTERLLAASSYTASGLGILGWYTTQNQRDSQSFLLYQSVVMTMAGLFQLFQKNDVETQYRSYEEWKKNHRTIVHSNAPSISLTPEGLTATLFF